MAYPPLMAMTKCPICGSATIARSALINNAPLAHVIEIDTKVSFRDFGTIDLCRCCACGYAWNNAAETVIGYEPTFLTNVPVSSRMMARHQELARYLSGQMAQAPGRVLEVGAGSGFLSMALSDIGHDVCALEPSAQLEEGLLSSRGVRTVNDWWPSFAVSSETFDLVVSVQVMEHSLSPQQFVTALAEVLAVDGLAYVEVPSGDWLWTHRSPIDIHAPHVSYFSRRSLEILIRKAGLRIVGQREIEHGRSCGFLLRRTDSNSSYSEELSVETEADSDGFAHGVAADSLALASAVNHLRERVADLNGVSALYGANAGTQSLLGWIPTGAWDCVLDDTSMYWGHAAYSEHVRIPIVNPDSVDLSRLSSVVIAAYIHDAFISERLRKLGFLGEIFSLRPPSLLTTGPQPLLA